MFGLNMDKGDFLTTILRSEKTVFSVTDIVILWREENIKATRVRLNYYVKKGDLYRIRRGLYAKDTNYDKPELAVKIFTPAYVSFETVLAKEGLIFQYQEKMTVASYLTREIEVDGQKYIFRKIKDSVLVNSMGVKQTNNTSVATTERALLDMLYFGDYQIDNLRGINWERVLEILPIYKNKRLVKTVSDLRKLK